jgi:hypothetical protein
MNVPRVHLWCVRDSLEGKLEFDDQSLSRQ